MRVLRIGLLVAAIVAIVWGTQQETSRTIDVTNDTAGARPEKPEGTLARLRALPRYLLPERGRVGGDTHLGGEPIALLVLGRAGAGWTAGNLTDTILLIVLDPSRERGTMLSIPRDLLVALPNGGKTKINTLWEIGSAGRQTTRERSMLIREAVEQITGVSVDEVVVIDVAGVESIVDALGGIALRVPERIDDPAFPTPGGGIEHFVLEPGFQVFDGRTAAKYVRTRHSPRGDFDRVRRQQQVLEAIVAKARGLRLAEDLDTIVALFLSLNDHIETTIAINDFPKMLTAANAIPFANVRTFALETLPAPSFGANRTPQRRTEASLLQGTAGSALIPRAGFSEYADIHQAIADLLQ